MIFTLQRALIGASFTFLCAVLGTNGKAFAQDTAASQDIWTDPSQTREPVDPSPPLSPDTVTPDTLASGTVTKNSLPGTPAPTAQLTTAVSKWPKLVLLAGPYAKFRDYVENAMRLTPGSAKDLEQTMQNFASIDGALLSTSLRAHVVLKAMQTPAFHNGVSQWGNTYDRRMIIKNLHINPAYVEQMPGYLQARKLVLRGIYEDSQAAQLAGSTYKELAYTLQKQSWGMQVRKGKALRLAAINNAHLAPNTTPDRLLSPLMRAYVPPKPEMPPALTAIANTDHPLTNTGPTNIDPTNVSLSNVGALNTTLQGLRPDADTALSTTLPQPSGLPQSSDLSQPSAVTEYIPDIAPAYSGTLQDLLATAAIHILDPYAPYPSALPARNTPDTMAECVDWARLHLSQCVAATRFVYENSFCIAKHQLKDEGRCLATLVSESGTAPTH